MTPTEQSPANADDKRSGLARGVRKGLQVAALAAALVPLGSIPVTPTDQLIGSPRAAHAAPGDVRTTVDVPSNIASACDGAEGAVGTALALVPGGKAGFPQSSVLLVTSCVSTGGSTIQIFFTDPNGDGAQVVKNIATIFPSTAATASKPTAGWEALVLRADKGDILACGTNGTKTVLWSIDFSPFNTIPDGSATFLRNGPTGSTCGSIAWDPSDGTVYQTPASGFNVLHSKNDGTALTAVPVPNAACNTSITGLGIAGTSLFVACAGTGGEISQPPKIAQLYKVDGSLTPRQFNYVGSSLTLRGVPDDPASLAGDEQLWTLTADGSGNALFVGFEMAGGTLGQRTGSPALNPGSCPAALVLPSGKPAGNVASDGDGLFNCWKDGGLWSDGLPGINYAGTYVIGASTTSRDVTLCVGPTTTAAEIDANCAKPGRKDLFVEVDYMDFHKPDTAAGGAVDLVRQMFKNAPVDSPTGISLHVQVDDLVTVNGKNHYTNVAFVPCTAAASPTDTTTVDFDAVKKLFFGTSAERASLGTKPNALNAKALVFRYALMAHNLLGLGTTSGCGEIGGNDFVVSLGSWASAVPAGKTVSHNVGNLDQQSGTFGHELGHTLGLRHGGGDNINCKPNYVSIMNYSLQFLSPTQRSLNYSTQELPTLDKTSLTESAGIGPQFTGMIAFGPVPALSKPFVTTAGGPINWNPTVDNSATDVGLSLDLPQTTSATGGCPTGQKGAPPGNFNDDGHSLIGFNDWVNLEYNFRTSVDFADGGHITSGETALTDPPTDTPPGITLETAAALSSDATPITVDLKPGDKNNNIDRKGDQDIEVVFFSGPGFDATRIVLGSLLLQGEGWTVPVKQKNNGDFQCDVRDAHRKDHLNDLVCHFKIPKNTVGANETEVLITGATSDDPPVPVGASVPITVHP